MSLESCKASVYVKSYFSLMNTFQAPGLCQARGFREEPGGPSHPFSSRSPVRGPLAKWPASLAAIEGLRRAGWAGHLSRQDLQFSPRAGASGYCFHLPLIFCQTVVRVPGRSSTEFFFRSCVPPLVSNPPSLVSSDTLIRII